MDGSRGVSGVSGSGVVVVGGMPMTPPDDCCSRAMLAVVNTILCICGTIQQFIAWVTCGYLCAPAAPQQPARPAPPTLESFKNPLITTILSKYRYEEAQLRAVIDRLFQIISAHQITEVRIETGASGTNYIIITSRDRPGLINTLRSHPKKIDFETDYARFGVPMFDNKNSVAIPMYATLGGASWMDAFVENPNDAVQHGLVRLLTESHGTQHDAGNIRKAAGNLLEALAGFPIKSVGSTAYAQWVNIEFNGPHSSAALSKLTSQFPRLTTLTPADQTSLQIQVTSLDVLLPEGRT